MDIYTNKRLRKTKCLCKIYTPALKTVWEIIIVKPALQLPPHHASGFWQFHRLHRRGCTKQNTFFVFLSLIFLENCGIFDDLILLESLKSRKKSQICIFCSTKWQYQLYTWKYIHTEMQIENTTPHEQCCAATLQHLLGWRDQTGQMFSLWGEAVEQLGPACPPLEGSRTQWGTAWRSLLCLLLWAEVGTGNL